MSRYRRLRIPREKCPIFGSSAEDRPSHNAASVVNNGLADAQGTPYDSHTGRWSHREPADTDEKATREGGWPVELCPMPFRKPPLRGRWRGDIAIPSLARGEGNTHQWGCCGASGGRPVSGGRLRRSAMNWSNSALS